MLTNYCPSKSLPLFLRATERRICSQACFRSTCIRKKLWFINASSTMKYRKSLSKLSSQFQKLPLLLLFFFPCLTLSLLIFLSSPLSPSTLSPSLFRSFSFSRPFFLSLGFPSFFPLPLSLSTVSLPSFSQHQHLTYRR